MIERERKRKRKEKGNTSARLDIIEMAYDSALGIQGKLRPKRPPSEK